MIWNEFPCLDFVDSEFADHTGGPRHYDRLAMTQWQCAFLDHWGWPAPVPAPPESEARLRQLRSHLRRLLEAAARGDDLRPGDVRQLNFHLAAAPFIYRIAGRREVRLVPLKPGWEAVIAELARSAAEVVTRFEPKRLKVCANPHCSWLFYDRTLNRSRRWCQTNICGNLVKVRRHRASRRETS